MNFYLINILIKYVLIWKLVRFIYEVIMLNWLVLVDEVRVNVLGYFVVIFDFIIWVIKK